MILHNHPRRQILLICTVLAILTFIAYVPVCYHDFVDYDDGRYVTKNPHVLMGITWESLHWAFTRYYASNWHPLTWLSHMLDVECFGLNSSWHHLTNLWLHIANALLIFLLLRSMTGAIWRSFFVGAAFALHPLHVESVAWVAERKDVLSTLFVLLTVAGYLSFVQRGGWGRYLITLFSFSLSLMAKPMYVTLPFVLLILDWWPLNRWRKDRRRSERSLKTRKLTKVDFPPASISRLVIEKIPLFILVIISCVVTYLGQQSGVSVSQMQMSLRIQNALVSYVAYLCKMFWPVDLAVLYPFPMNGLPLWKPIAALLLLASLSALFIYHRRERKYLLAGWLWYLGTLLPVIGLVQVGLQAMADRYTYFPLIGVFIMLSWAMVELLSKRRHHQIILGSAAGLLIIAMLIGTRTQLRYWRDSFTLYDHARAVTRDNFFMYNNLGALYLRQDQLDKAADCFGEALRILPYYTKAYDNLGPSFQRIMYNNLGTLYLRQNQLDKAADCFREALRIQPYYMKAHNNLGLTLQRQGRLDEAIDCFRMAQRINPSQIEVGNNLGFALQEQGRLEEAIHAYRKVLQLQPDFVDAINNLARILATAGDSNIRNPTEAVELAGRACELNAYENPDLLDTLAAAYAAAGQFDRAVKTARTALTLAEASNQKNLAQDINHRLQLYQTGQAYYESPSIKETPGQGKDSSAAPADNKK